MRIEWATRSASPAAAFHCGASHLLGKIIAAHRGGDFLLFFALFAVLSGEAGSRRALLPAAIEVHAMPEHGDNCAAGLEDEDPRLQRRLAAGEGGCQQRTRQQRETDVWHERK